MHNTSYTFTLSVEVTDYASVAMESTLVICKNLRGAKIKPFKYGLFYLYVGVVHFYLTNYSECTWELHVTHETRFLCFAMFELKHKITETVKITFL